MTNKTPDKEHMRMLEALATVSSLAFMAVIDFLLAYFGGDWLIWKPATIRCGASASVWQ